MKNRTVKHELTPLQQSLFSQLIDIMLVDRRRLSARIHGIGKIKNQEANIELATQQEVETLKKEKLKIKDELYAILRQYSAK